MNKTLTLVTMSLSLLACTGGIEGGDRSGLTGAGTGVVGAGTAGTGVVGAGTAGTSIVDPGTSGTAGTGVVGMGTAGTGVVDPGTAGTGAGGTPSCGPGAIPADVAAMISSTCIACHGSPPIAGVPSSLATYASLTAPATTDKTKSVAQVALARIQPGAAMPMPPSPLTPPTSAQVAAFQAWVQAGTPPASCPDGGAPIDAGGAIADPYSTPVVCTSKTMWTQGTRGSGNMQPGVACIACHSKGEGPPFALGGTVYPTAHEPDNCNGGAVTSMSRVVVTGADGNTITLTPNMAGNFSYGGALATPYKVKVTYMGRERAMIAAQTSGDCNACHTEMGAMMAPGRILLP
jgi:hypothetical protein